ncbi:MAG: ABC transporter permease subunit [Chloroflexi bacterium]|nr:ABC transporter permease subunit [Chloroflexota bacterium]
MNAAIAALLWKETRQIPRKRSAVISAVLFPLLFFVALPLGNIVGIRAAAVSAPVGPNAPAGFGNIAGDPILMMRDFMLPLFITLGGLVIPSIAATYTIIGERERRTLELLVALPVSLAQIVFAKLIAVLLLATGIAVPLFLTDALVMIALGIASPVDALGLLFLLVAALVYSTSSALVVALIAADFRTANNVNGALLGPTILLVMAAMALLPGGVLRSVVLGVAFLAVATILTAVALRVLTLERFLR